MTCSGLRLCLLLIGAALVLSPFTATAGAAVPTVNACVAAKGKKKGLMRLVPPTKACKANRGQKRVTWNVTGPRGPIGPGGTTAQLTQLVQDQADQITALTQNLADVTGVLNGVTHGDLLGAITNSTKLNGISGADLNSVVAGLPKLDALCTQLSAVTGRTDVLRTAIAGLSLNGVLSALGGLLNIPALPSALGAFNCPS